MHLLCTGIRYGLAKSRIYELFKAAWLQNPNALSYSGKGDNLIPIIHILDLYRLIRRMVNPVDAKTAQEKELLA
jgi:adenylate kinase